MIRLIVEKDGGGFVYFIGNCCLQRRIVLLRSFQFSSEENWGDL